jgi:SAM-dependent methyltransferase
VTLGTLTKSGGVSDILRCPVTGEPLALTDGRLITESGGRGYEIVDDIPVLVSPERTLFDARHAAAEREAPGLWAQTRASLRRRLTANSVSRRNLGRLATLLEAPGSHARPARVLVIGGGILGFGMEELLDCPWIELVETDVYRGPRTAIVCDAHDLPFANGSFDAVIAQAVLEHVAAPVRAVDELHRVLRDQGLIYSEIPFMQQVHEGAFDFTRWTMTGHRRLLHDFDEIESGVVGGAGEALAWSLRYYAIALIGSRGLATRLASGLVNLLTLPLRWTDALIRGRPETIDAASGTYFLGRRRSAPVTDSAIVARHVGANRDPGR